MDKQIIISFKEEDSEYIRVELDVRNCTAAEICVAAETLAREASKHIQRQKGGTLN